ncbi:MAG TPA: hypothetical protein VJ927_11270 [Actinomycetota bacterium]|nr:hypothetical protein [Actinomycetota bacterium]
MEPTRILIVANQTAAGTALQNEVRRRHEGGPCSFTLVVPATHPTEHLTWTEGEAIEIAERHLAAALEKLRETGADVEGRAGDANPLEAVNDALIGEKYDEIILSTLHAGASRWLNQDLPHRMERRFELPLTTVIAEKEPATSG